MGLIFRKRIALTRTARVNVSRRGVSVAKRARRVTFNSRRRVTVRVLPGLAFELGKRR